MDRNGYIGRAPADSSVVVARQVYSPSGVTTDFTFNSGYVPGYIDLYLNGARMVEGSDYTATDTNTIHLITAATNGDVLEAVAYKAYNATTSNRIGIQSAGSVIGNVDTLNFVGTGNTFLINGTTVDVSISGGAGAGGTWANYDGMTGITTSKKVRIQNNLDVTGVATFGGSVSIAGTLTYEDVHNVDSVGIITARAGIKVTGGNLDIGASPASASQLTVRAASPHLSLYATPGSNTSQLNLGDTDDHDIGNIKYDQNDNSMQFTTNASEQVRITSAGLVGIGTVTPLALYRSVSIHGPANDEGGVLDLATKNLSSRGYVFNDSNGLSVQTATNHPILLKTNNAERLRIASSGQIGLGGANYGTSGQVILSNGSGSAPTWGDVPAAGLTTEALVSSGIVTTLNLTAAQDHKVTASGITTITVSGGTESESHTVRIINSGITTVGFSTYFLFPSGSAPSLPTADGAISLISFTVNRVGAGGTQLLAGASLNFS